MLPRQKKLIMRAHCMTPKRRETINRVLDLRQPDLTVITERVVKERNLAAIVRTCDAVGIADIHCVQSAELYRSYRGTSASAHKYVDVTLHDDVTVPIANAKQLGMQVVAAHLSKDAVDFREVDFSKPTALLLGTELDGVEAETEKLCDTNIVIPMMGMVESFNVSVACAIILAEAQRQRQACGLYRQSRLEERQREKLFFKWAYPKLAAHCDERGLSYPPLNENGDLIAGTAPSNIERL